MGEEGSFLSSFSLCCSDMFFPAGDPCLRSTPQHCYAFRPCLGLKRGVRITYPFYTVLPKRDMAMLYRIPCTLYAMFRLRTLGEHGLGVTRGSPWGGITKTCIFNIAVKEWETDFRDENNCRLIKSNLRVHGRGFHS